MFVCIHSCLSKFMCMHVYIINNDCINNMYDYISECIYIIYIPESMHIYLYVYINYTEIDANLHHIIYMYVYIFVYVCMYSFIPIKVYM